MIEVLTIFLVIAFIFTAICLFMAYKSLKEKEVYNNLIINYDSKSQTLPGGRVRSHVPGTDKYGKAKTNDAGCAVITSVSCASVSSCGSSGSDAGGFGGGDSGGGGASASCASASSCSSSAGCSSGCSSGCGGGGGD